MSRTDDAPVRLLHRIAREHGDRTYLIDAPTGRSWTHAEFLGAAGALARTLRERGAAPGDRLGAVLGNAPEFALLYVASLLAGITLAPLNPDLADGAVAQLLELGDIGHLVVDAAGFERLGPGRIDRHPLLGLGPRPEGREGLPAWTDIEALAASGAPEGELPEPPDTDAPWTMFFTSGTTGTPKGVAHTARALMGNARTFNAAMGLDSGTRIHHIFSMAYMAGFLNTLLCPLLAGGSVVAGERFGPMTAMRFWRTPMRHGANTLWLVPTIMESLLRIDRDPEARGYASGLRAVMCGTAPLPPALRARFEEKYGVAVLESYGLTELLLVAGNVPGRDGGRSVGRPLPGVEIRMQGEGGSEGDEPGQIFVRTPYACLSVQGAGSAGADAAGWFPTGDVGLVDEAGRLVIHDRAKDVIIRGGFNISPRAVEEALEEHPAVQRAAVVGLPHEFYGEQTAAAVIPRPGQDETALRAELLEHCRARLAANQVPDVLALVTEFPLGTTGKLLRDELREALLPLAEAPRAARREPRAEEAS